MDPLQHYLSVLELENSEQLTEFLKSVQVTVSRQYSVFIYSFVTPEIRGSHYVNQVCKVCCFYPSNYFKSLFIWINKTFSQNNINICLLLYYLETSVMFQHKGFGMKFSPVTSVQLSSESDSSGSNTWIPWAWSLWSFASSSRLARSKS